MLKTSAKTKRDIGNTQTTDTTTPTAVEESRLSLALVFLLILDDTLFKGTVSSFLMTAAISVFSCSMVVVLTSVGMTCLQRQRLCSRDRSSTPVERVAEVGGDDVGAAVGDGMSVVPENRDTFHGVMVVSLDLTGPRAVVS